MTRLRLGKRVELDGDEAGGWWSESAVRADGRRSRSARVDPQSVLDPLMIVSLYRPAVPGSGRCLAVAVPRNDLQQAFRWVTFADECVGPTGQSCSAQFWPPTERDHP